MSNNLLVISQLIGGILSDQIPILNKYYQILPTVITICIGYVYTLANVYMYSIVILCALVYIIYNYKFDNNDASFIINNNYDISNIIGILLIRDDILTIIDKKKVYFKASDSGYYCNISNINTVIFFGEIIVEYEKRRYIIHGYDMNEEIDDKKKKFYYIKISTTAKDVNLNEIFKEWTDMYDSKSNTIVRTYTIYSNYDYKTLCTYNCTKQTYEEKKNLYWSTYFHPQREYIYNKIYNYINYFDDIIITGHCPSANFLLYGPPGTGKTSIVYRLAKIFNLNISQINIRKYCNHANKFIADMSQRDRIILIDEIDFDMDYIDKYNEKYNRELFENKDNADKDSILTNGDIYNAIQGPIPIEKRIIIATTNNYDKMKDKYTPLFRDGRLYPIKCGNFSASTLCEVSNHFYKEDIKLQTDVVNIPPSEIMSFVTSEKSFDKFKSWLNTRLEYN